MNDERVVYEREKEDVGIRMGFWRGGQRNVQVKSGGEEKKDNP